MNTEYNMRLIKAYNKRFGLPQQKPVFVYDFAANYIDDESDKKVFLTGENILSLASVFTGISVKDMESKSRAREIVFARRLFAYGCKMETKLSLKTIGNLIGGRDHSTVIALLEGLNDLMDTEKETLETVKKFHSIIKNIK